MRKCDGSRLSNGSGFDGLLCLKDWRRLNNPLKRKGNRRLGRRSQRDGLLFNYRLLVSPVAIAIGVRTLDCSQHLKSGLPLLSLCRRRTFVPPIDLKLSDKVIKPREAVLELVKLDFVGIVFEAACPFEPAFGGRTRQLRRRGLFRDLH